MPATRVLGAGSVMAAVLAAWAVGLRTAERPPKAPDAAWANPLGPGLGPAVLAPVSLRAAGKSPGTEQAATAPVENPQLAGENPQLTGENPHLTGKNPQPAGENPHLAGENPQLAGENPQLAGENPQLAKENPQLTGKNPQLTGKNPQLTGENPQPAETGLPAQMARTRDLIFAPTGEPQLRINVHGHTGSVRALGFTPDGVRLCSGGWDKIVQVWNLRAATRDLQGVFLGERTLRWQVARGPLGQIHTLAISPRDGLLALAGHSAMGSLGEILLVNPLQGTLEHVLDGHRQAVCSLAFSPDGAWLASADVQGQVILWQSPGWKPRILYLPDEKTYGARRAQQIASQPHFRPVAIAGDALFLPVNVGEDAAGQLQWKLQRVPLANPQQAHTFDTVHGGMVTALAVSRDGRRLASADLAGHLFLWDLGTATVRSLRGGAVVLSLVFVPDGGTLVAGTAQRAGNGTGEMQVWDVAAASLRRRRNTADHVTACAVSPDGRQVAYSGGKDFEVFVEPVDGSALPVVLGGKGRRILKVAFARDEPFYRVAFGVRLNQRGFNDYGDLERAFDAQRLELQPEGRLDPQMWITGQTYAGTWSVQWQARGLQLFRDGQPQGAVVFQTALQEGAPRSYCWIPDAQGQPWAIAVGTDVQNSIYVYRLAEKGPCPLLRHFRGHQDAVLSLAVSRDVRYLVSGSADGTLAFWSLSDYEQGNSLWGRWGGELAVEAPPGGAGQLVVRRIHPAGPLYYKNVREGDVITAIRWYAEAQGQKPFEATQPEQILAALREMAWGTLVEFQTSRAGVAQGGFQLRPAWPALASLFISADDEWAFWTPEGYFDASVNGHTLFGWQVNQGVERMPAFYRADHFRRRLEQPGVLEHLLPAGSLREAFRRAERKPAEDLPAAVSHQIVQSPALEILQPEFDAPLPGNEARVLVRVQVPVTTELAEAKIYANGVAGRDRRLVAQRRTPRYLEHTYQWRVPLPAEETSLIQVIVGTKSEVTASTDLVVRRVNPQPPRPRKMYLVAVGINRYADAKVPPLEFSTRDAQAFCEVLRRQSRGLYDIVAETLLLNEQVTPAAWRHTLEDIRRRMRDQAGPDDLLVIFLAGHGWEDVRTGQYYFIGHEFRMANLGRSYEGCLSWDDFRLLADIPCRKLVFLDTCHSGAIQPPRSRNLKAAIRRLQDDVIFTVAASKGGQLAAEHPQWKHGVFTKCLLDALEGRAAPAGPPEITLNDVVRYVEAAVPRVTFTLTQGSRTQEPVAAPDRLLAYAKIPLARTQAPGKAQRGAQGHTRVLSLAR